VVQPRIDFPASDEGAIRRETQRIRERQKLEQLAQGIGGPGTRVADPNLFQRFLATTGEQYTRVNQAAQSFLPSNQEIVSYLGEIGQELLRSPIPEGFVTGAPSALQPAARVIRESAAPAAAATLPLGGSARVVGGGLLGAAGGATAGRAIGGDTGELIGAIGGGIAGGVPAVQRLAGRGIIRAGDEAAYQLQGRQAARAATEPPKDEYTGDIIADIFATLQKFSQNKAAARQFLHQSIDPLIARQYGRPLPIMDVFVPLHGDGEVLFAVSTAGWRPKMEAMGFQFVRQHGFDDLYRAPEAAAPLRPAITAGALTGRQIAPAAQAVAPPPAAAPPPQPPIPPAAPPRVPPAGAVPPAGQPPDDPVTKLVSVIQGIQKRSPALRAQLAIERSKEAGTRATVGMERAGQVPASEAGRAFRSALGGQMPRVPDFPAVRDSFTPDDVEGLYSRIWRTDILRPFEKGNANDALIKLLQPEGLAVPTPSEMTLLERVFGPEVRRALEDISKGRGRRIWEQTVDVLNIPRALRSSFDISAVLRQGGILTVSHPQKAFGGRDSAFVRMIRSMRSPQAYDESLSRIRSDSDFDLIAGAGRRNRLFIADTAETRLTAREEAFLSRWASKIPGIKGSQRGFNTYLNEMKWKTAKSYVNGLRSEGVDPAVAEKGLDTMTRFLNVATGRGSLGSLERHQLLQEIATTAFWSPRLTVSRFQVLVEGLRSLKNLNAADPALRAASRQIAGDLVKYTGGVLGFMSILKLSGLADAEMDPRSSDFAKIRIGPTRIDAWAGFQQPLRYTAQFITGQSKPITTKGIRNLPRDEVLGRFLRSKLAPGPVSLGATFAPEDTPISGLTGGGRTFIGERIVPGPARPYKTVPDRTAGLGNTLLEETLLPLLYSDIDEAIREQGLAQGMLFGAAPVVGLGITIIPDDEGQATTPGQKMKNF